MHHSIDIYITYKVILLIILVPNQLLHYWLYFLHPCSCQFVIANLYFLWITGILSTFVLLRTLRQKRGQLILQEIGKKRKMKIELWKKKFFSQLSWKERSRWEKGSRDFWEELLAGCLRLLLRSWGKNTLDSSSGRMRGRGRRPGAICPVKVF